MADKPIIIRAASGPTPDTPPAKHTPSPAIFFNALRRQREFRVLRAGQDFHENRLSYGMNLNGKMVILRTPGEYIYSGDLHEHKIGIKLVDDLMPHMSEKGIERFLKKEPVDGRELLSELEAYFRRHAIYHWPSTPAVLAHWTLATYLYMAFDIFGYIRLTSHEPSAGKSLVCTLLGSVAFRGKPPDINATPAVIFRTVDEEGYVMTLDEFENTAEESATAVNGICNAGFAFNARVQRCEPKTQKVISYRLYCPKVLAGLTAVSPALESRTIHLRMFKKDPKEKITAFNATSMAAYLQSLRDACSIWALQNAPAVASVSRLMALPVPMDDRQSNIMLPLYAVNQIAQSPREPLDDLALRLAAFRAGKEESDAIVLLTVLRDYYLHHWRGKDEMRIHSHYLSELLGVAGVKITDEKQAREWLRGFDWKTDQVRMTGMMQPCCPDSRKGARITRESLDKWLGQYSIPWTPEE
jgi:hypothetical protein